MYILGIETSCDETSCAILKNYQVLSNITVSSLQEHKKYGGIVPEIATRAHIKNIDKVLKIALKEARISLERIDLISVTYKPGLMGALLVGVNFAKALALALNAPFIGVNHLYAHLIAPFLNGRERLKFPFLGVVVSGGHSEIYYVDDFDKIRIVGRTRDDACGEAFDKIARALNLGYPGGPAIDALFKPKYKNEFSFRCGRIGFDLSFSGIKTALIYKKIELERRRNLDRKTKIKLISSFQEAVVKVIVSTVLDAAGKFKLKRVVCGGGVAANRYLRKTLQEEAENVEIFIAPPEYTTDNAAVAAGLGFYLYKRRGVESNFNLNVEAN